MKKPPFLLLLLITFAVFTQQANAKCNGITLHTYPFPTYPPLDQQVFIHNDTAFVGANDSTEIYAQYDYNCHYLLGDTFLWYLNDSLIARTWSFATDGNWYYMQKLWISRPGNYTVCAQSFPSYKWNQLTVIQNNMTSTEPAYPASGYFSLFPNPCSGSFNLSFTHDPVRIELRTIQGQVVREWIGCDSSLLVADLTGLSSGIYVVRVIYPGATSTRRVIIL